MGALAMKDATAAALPLMIRGAIDALTAGRALRTVFLFAAALAGICLVKGIFQYWMRVVLIGVSRDIEFEMRNELFRKLVSLAPEYYAKNRTGDVMARATNDLNAVRMMLGPGVMYWTETILTFVITIAVMASIDWRAYGTRDLAGSACKRRDDCVRPAHPHAFRGHSGNVLRHQQPRAGESFGHADVARFRAGRCRGAEVRALKPRVHRAEREAGEGARILPTAA
jgi:ABC-type multidrug transport system fused ATPase/permease subunit